MDDYNKEAQSNAKAIESEIQSLEKWNRDWSIHQYKEFWAHAHKISVMFMILKPLGPDDGELLWERFNTYCQEVEQRQQTKHLDRELQDQIDSAWDDDFRNQVNQWLSESEEKIRKIKKYLEGKDRGLE
jgi:hypothetical protein